MKTNTCKICGREPKIEYHKDGDKVLISCVNDEHYVAMEYPSRQEAVEKWNTLMIGVSH